MSKSLKFRYKTKKRDNLQCSGCVIVTPKRSGGNNKEKISPSPSLVASRSLRFSDREIEKRVSI